MFDRRAFAHDVHTYGHQMVQVPCINSWPRSFWLYLTDPRERAATKFFQAVAASGFSVSGITEIWLMGNDITVVGAADNVAITPVAVAMTTFGFFVYRKVKKYRPGLKWVEVN